MSYIRVPPPKPQRLNAGIIITIISACAIVIGLAFITALQPPAQKQQSWSIKNLSHQIPIAPPQIITQLPDYTDAKRINEMLSMHRGPIVRTPPWGKWLLSQINLMKQGDREITEKIMQLDNNYYQVHPDFGFHR